MDSISLRILSISRDLRTNYSITLSHPFLRSTPKYDVPDTKFVNSTHAVRLRPLGTVPMSVLDKMDTDSTPRTPWAQRHLFIS